MNYEDHEFERTAPARPTPSPEEQLDITLRTQKRWDLYDNPEGPVQTGEITVDEAWLIYKAFAQKLKEEKEARKSEQ